MFSISINNNDFWTSITQKSCVLCHPLFLSINHTKYFTSIQFLTQPFCVVCHFTLCNFTITAYPFFFMPYRRRFYRSRSNPDKYSVETSAGQVTAGENGDANVIVVPAADLQGMRKVKHVTVQIANAGAPSAASNVLYWALVYVPEGYQPNTLNITGTGLYEPNQFIMAAGVYDFDAGPCRITSPISRNLNGGDRILLVVKAQASGYVYQYIVRYAITLQ